MTTVALFDLDGTLVHFDRPFEGIIGDTCRAVGFAPPDGLPRRYVELFFEHLRDGAADPYHHGAMDLVAEFGLDLDPGGFAERYVEAELAATSVPEPVRETLDALSAEYTLGVLTNGHGPVQRRKLDAHGLAEYFDDVVAATDVGVLKPDPEVFRLAMERLPAERHVYVGDSLEYDVRPAKALGLGTVLVGDAIAADGGVSDDVDLHVPEPADFGRIRRLLE